jgi:hypothetical protein
MSREAESMKSESRRCRWTAAIGVAVLVVYPLSIGPVYRIVHPTGRPTSFRRQDWPAVVPVVYQPLGFACSKWWPAESAVCRYLALWGEGPSCGTYAK